MAQNTGFSRFFFSVVESRKAVFCSCGSEGKFTWIR